MKSLVRWGTTMSLIASTLLTSWLGKVPKVLALPEADIIKLLQTVPVFTITTEEGGPLVATIEDNQKVTQVFMSSQDADGFLDKLRQHQPDVGNKVKVQAVSLGEIYRFALANNSDVNKESLQFVYVPMKSAIDSAKKLLDTKGQEYKGGVPLFILRGGPENSMLTIQQNEREVIPLFFEEAPIQAITEKMKKDQPNIVESIKIEVVPLENVIGLLQTKNDEALKQIQLVPPEETIQFIQNKIKLEQAQES